MKAAAIATIGYEGISVEEFVARLKRNRIALLLDVRELPLSRRRGFSKSALSKLVARAGIQYQHMRELGCPKPVRDRYRLDSDWAQYLKSFKEHLRSQSSAISALATLAKANRVALVCYEADPQMCHRTIVAQAAASKNGATVVHLLACDTRTATRPLAA
jgi:uncharacterized protein (DUF488 family)